MTVTSIKMMTRTGQELSGTPHTSSGWDFSRFPLLQNNALNKYHRCEMIFVCWCSQHVLKVIADVTNKFYSRKFNFKTLLKHFDIFQQLLLVNNKKKTKWFAKKYWYQDVDDKLWQKFRFNIFLPGHSRAQFWIPPPKWGSW